MKGAKPQPVGNVIPMRGDAQRAVPEPYEWMSDAAKDVWRDLAPVLVQKDRFEPEFRHQFSAYCESVANFIAATNELVLLGMYYTVKTRNGNQQKKTAPWSIQQEAMAQMRRDAALFGLSPVDAARLSTSGQGDLFDQLNKALSGDDDNAGA